MSLDLRRCEPLAARPDYIELYQRGILPAVQHSAAGRSKVVEIKGRQVSVPDFHAASLGLRIFSDTVVFYTRDDSFESFLTTVNTSFMLLQFGFAGGKDPFRGAIAHGDFIDDGQFTILGTALEQAYAAEQAQVWAGCMLSGSCLAVAEGRGYLQSFRSTHEELARTIGDVTKRTSALENARRLVKYDVPLQVTNKPGPTQYIEKQAYVIDWTIRMYEGAAVASFDASTNAHARRIAENTKVFEQWARANNR